MSVWDSSHDHYKDEIISSRKKSINWKEALNIIEYCDNILMHIVSNSYKVTSRIR